MAFKTARPLKAIADDADFGDEPQLFACNAEPVRAVAGGAVTAPNYHCEAAGTAFAARFDFPSRSTKEGGKSSADSDDVESEGEDYGRGKGTKDKATGSFKLSEVLKGVNLYELMGISEGASQDEIKKAYRNLALTAHPDKQAHLGEAEAKKVQERFVQIQEAYELLSDTAKRMQYDSSLDFDDSLPKFKADSGEDFYEVFGECFRRNARFASKRPVPDIGGPDSKPEELKRFYSYWHEFQSWRDPLVLAQKDGEELCDLNEAECREEKRWMMRENMRVAKSYKQAERDRIGELVRRAEANDPRILAEKEAKKAAREAEMARRYEEKMAVVRAKEEAERKKREAEEAAAKIEAEKRAKEKAVREAAKEKVKKMRQRLRSFHPQVKHLVSVEQLNEVCLRFEEAALRELGDSVEKALKKKDNMESAASLMHAAIESLGMKAVLTMKVEDDAQSTSSGGPSEESVVVLSLEEQRQQEQKRREAEKRAAEEEARKAEERAQREAEKAEQKKLRDEQRRKEQQAAETKKRQQEKKAEEKARKAEERKQREEEQEAQKKEKKKEEDRQRAAEQAEKDRLEAAARREEQEGERVAQLFAADRLDRLQKLDRASEQELGEQLEQAFSDDVSIAAALRLLQANCASAGTEAMIDKAMALVMQAGPAWPLALAPPATIKLPNAVRNRVKKARQRLRDLALASFPKLSEAGGSEADVTEWQRCIIDGAIEPPVWTPEEVEKNEEASPKQQEQQQQPAAGKKAKKPKENSKGEEDLDALLKEFGATPTSTPAPKKGGGKKKK